jgi:hypothetical protein
LNYAERIDPDVLKIEESRYVKSILDGSWELIMGYSTFHLRQVARQCLKIFFLAPTIAKGKISGIRILQLLNLNQPFTISAIIQKDKTFGKS